LYSEELELELRITEGELNLFHRGTDDRLLTHLETANKESAARKQETKARRQETKARQRETEARQLAEVEVARLKAELAALKRQMETDKS